MAARETVEMGSRWCVGNGRTVEIWRDRWIPTPDNFKVVTPQGPNVELVTPQGLNVELVKVEQLIDGNTGMWKVAQIKKTFFPP